MRKPHASSHKNSGIYFDYAATTPVDPAVLRAMEPYFGVKFGNAGSLHSFGQEAVAALDRSRETIARLIGRPPAAGFREIVFTGSATEANNLAFRGIVRRFWWDFFKEHGRKGASKAVVPRIITTAIEHESVLETLRDMERRGAARATILPVGRDGVVDAKKLKAALDERTVLVSVMYANNEIGTVQPIAEIGNIIADFRRENAYPLFHTDAVQAFQFLDCNADTLGVDLMTLSAHKIYGPKGVGALYVRNSKLSRSGIVSDFGFRASSLPAVSPLVTGGGQEFGLRSGTENIPLIVGFAKAAELAAARRASESERIGGLMRHFLGKLKAAYPQIRINGIHGSSRHAPHLPHIANIHFPGERAEALLTKWDIAGIAASAGSACSARSYEPSRVLLALGYSKKRAEESIRFSFGAPTTKEEVDRAIRIIKMQK